jgi:hypothetical protein
MFLVLICPYDGFYICANFHINLSPVFICHFVAARIPNIHNVWVVFQIRPRVYHIGDFSDDAGTCLRSKNARLPTFYHDYALCPSNRAVYHKWTGYLFHCPRLPRQASVRGTKLPRRHEASTSHLRQFLTNIRKT